MSKCIKYIKADLYRYSKNTNFKSFVKQYFYIGQGFKFSVWLRICHFTYNKKIYRYTFFILARFMYKHYSYLYGYDIPFNIEIGPGLLIFHFGTIVFVPKKCGKNATISHSTTVGMKIVNGEKYFPIIGDNLYMAPGSKIIGNIVVGDNVAIGANCVLTHNADNNGVFIGIPGKEISKQGSYEYVNNPI